MSDMEIKLSSGCGYCNKCNGSLLGGTIESGELMYLDIYFCESCKMLFVHQNEG